MAELFERPLGNQPDPTRVTSPSAPALRWLPMLALLIVVAAVVMLTVNSQRKNPAGVSPAQTSQNSPAAPNRATTHS